MTFRRDLKRRIRQRQAETGERYTTARAHIVGQKNSLVVELHEIAERPGVLCPVRATPSARPYAQQLLDHLRKILLGPVEGLEPMRAAVLEGRGDSPRHRPLVALLTQVRDFRIGLEQGLRGPGLGGRVLAFDAELDGETSTVLARLVPRHDATPLLLLSLFDDDAFLDSAWWRP